MFHGLALFLLLWGVIVLPGAWGASASTAKGEVEGFALEIPDETGQTQALLEGNKAVFDPAGAIHITDVRAKIYQKENQKEKDKGSGSILVRSPLAEYHRNTKVVTSDKPVKVDSHDAHITGTGLVWEPEKQTIWIRENVRVVMKNVPKDDGK